MTEQHYKEFKVWLTDQAYGQHNYSSDSREAYIRTLMQLREIKYAASSKEE